MMSVLERVTIGFRCPMDWDAMAGDERERFCSKCQKTVTDLSQMSREEAEAFVEEAGALGQACVRLRRDAEGRLVTQGCGSKAVNERQIRKVVLGAAAAGSLGLAACSGSSVQDDPPLVGMICLPEEGK
ncbi:hypothetical protein AAFN60_20690 [Roseibacillus persicicus]|uniref:hypothetical protein n=1 Tax=Roseibacillus persicicus TaxID=454148 RepID=UPI00398B613F